MLYKVIIFGTGTSSEVIEEALNNNTTVIAYADNDIKNQGRIKNNIPILNPDFIVDYEFDYILIASQFNEEIYHQLLKIGIKKDKIFQFYKYLDLRYNYVNNSIQKFSSHSNTEILVTGISYTNSSIREDLLIRKVHKFTFGSQDLYYDYNIIKHIFKSYPEQSSNVKYIIIGLCYYSFQYDLSLSAMKNKTVLYDQILNDSHNFKGIEEFYEQHDINKRIANNIFKKNEQGISVFTWKSKSFNLQEMESLGKKQAETDCTKNYPNTVKENIKILKKYLEMADNYDIKPIIIVSPASIYYTEFFSKRIEEEFIYIIKELKKEYSFQYIDYFRSDKFNNDDFSDVSHLNAKGAEKFTKLLNEIIQW